MNAAARAKWTKKLRDLSEQVDAMVEEMGRAVTARDRADGLPPGCALEDLEIAAGHISEAADTLEEREGK